MPKSNNASYIPFDINLDLPIVYIRPKFQDWLGSQLPSRYKVTGFSLIIPQNPIHSRERMLRIYINGNENPAHVLETTCVLEKGELGFTFKAASLTPRWVNWYLRFRKGGVENPQSTLVPSSKHPATVRGQGLLYAHAEDIGFIGDGHPKGWVNFGSGVSQ